MLERTFDADKFDAVMRHPSVFPYVSLGMELSEVGSSAPLVNDEANVCLMNEHGGFMFRQFAPDQYDVHTVFLPSGRGKKALDAALEAKQIMFNTYHARRLITFVPHDNTPARKLAEAAGFVADRDAECLGVEGVTMVMEATCQ
jgi:RimJ/RimL family protein N-acetyltransferase